MVHNLSRENSIFCQFLAELRDEVIQRDPMRFRRNLERISEIMAYEVSKKLKYQSKAITTTLGVADAQVLADEVVLATILRAGLPMHQGFLNYFDRAESAFVSAYRKITSGDDYDVHVEYCAAPNINGKTLIITDPMLATGTSMVLVHHALKKHGIPKQLHLVTAIATQEAIEFVLSKLPSNTTIWVGAIDEELTAQSYIVPGLGDAGDLAFGDKL
jgi:uracil phosphoribosyltransferase